MFGVGVTLKATPLLAWPPTVTTRLPVVAPAGAVAVMLLVVQLVIVVAAAPLNVTVLPLNCEDRKFVPAITTDDPLGPAFGLRLDIVGAAVAKGKTIRESKLPFNVPSISSSPLNELLEVPVRLTDRKSVV